MTITHLYIKNMCCDRCIGIVQDLLKESGYNPVSVVIGEAVIEGNLSQIAIKHLKEKLQQNGLDIVENKYQKVVIKIHASVCKYIREEIHDEKRKKKLSAYLADIMGKSYYTLSRLFSSLTGMTIEKYYIRLKMEKAKEMLVQGEYELSEIAWQLGYGSLQAFITQFKKETGKTPGEYRLNPLPVRIHWDKLLWQHFEQKSK